MKKAIWSTVLMAVALLAIYVAWISVRVQQQAGLEEARPADVILVLGAAEYRGRPSPVLKARLDHALDLYARKLAPRILTTGGAGGDPVFTESTVGRSYLMSRGVPSEMIIVEREGDSTAYSTSAAAEIMQRMDLKSAIVVTDGYHIWRVKKMLEARGITAWGSPRPEKARRSFKDQWNYVKQAIGYVLWSVGVSV
jgi:vancomycin permeability regulator SanA